MTELSEGVAAEVDRQMREYVRLRREAEEAEAEAREKKAALERSKGELWDFLESAGLRTIHHELGRVTRTAVIKAQVRDQEALAESLSDLGLLEAFTKRAWRQAELNAFAKERVAEGEELPDGMDTWVERRITYSRVR